MTFDSIANSVKNIIILIQDEILKFKRMEIADNKIINNETNDYDIKLIMTPMEVLEDSIDQPIPYNKKIDIPNYFKPPTALTKNET